MPSFTNRNIISAFLQAAADNPEGIALIQDGVSVTYSQLLEEVIATAGLYCSRGIEQGDMALVFVPMSLPLYRIVLALFYIGACPVFLDEWVSRARLRACLEVVDCKAIIAKPAYLFLSRLIGPTRRIPVRIAAGKSAGLQAGRPQPAEVSGADTALVTFTTGSTGIPKAADRTHEYLFAQLHALSPLLNKVGSPCMTLLPIVVLLHLAVGKAAVLPPKRFKAAEPATIGHLAAAIVYSGPEALIASPAIVSMLIHDPGSSSNEALQQAFRSIRSVITGGGPVYPNLAAQMITSFPAAAITAVYGSTEAEPISHITAKELAAASLDMLLTKGLPVGLPDEAAEVAILTMDAEPCDMDDRAAFERGLPPKNVPGEVIVAGAHVLRHYISNPVAEAQTKLHAGGKVWHRTGDCGLLDDAGRLYLLGRCNELFAWQGRQYYPAIVTYGLQVLAGINSSAALLRDGRPCLILEERERILLPGVKAALLQLQLPDAAIRFIPKIPKDPRHRTKVDYAALAGMLGK